MKLLVFATVLLSSLQISIQSPLHIQKRAAFYIANETACVVDNTVYYSGDPIPTDDPCEACKCRPPGFACVLKECEKKPGCRAIRRAGYCCPEYICGCEHNGRMYRDGDEIRDSQNPCYTCHCQGSSIACAFIDCFFRVDCAPEYVAGECCPHYNNCFTAGETNKTVPRDNVPTIHRIAKPDFYLTTLKDVLKVTQPPITTTEITTDTPPVEITNSDPLQKIETVPPTESASADFSTPKSTKTPEHPITDLKSNHADLSKSTTHAGEVSDSLEVTNEPETKPSGEGEKESESSDSYSTTVKAIKLTEDITTTQIIPEQTKSTVNEIKVEESVPNVEGELDKENSIDVLLKSNNGLKQDELTTLDATTADTKSSQASITQEVSKYTTTTAPKDDEKVITTIPYEVRQGTGNEISTEAPKTNELIVSTSSSVTQQEVGNSSAQGKNLKLSEGENALEISESETTKLQEVQITTEKSTTVPKSVETTEIDELATTLERHETDIKPSAEVETAKDSEESADQIKSVDLHSSVDKLEDLKQEISVTTPSPQKQVTITQESSTLNNEDTLKDEKILSDLKLDTLEKEDKKEDTTTVIAVTSLNTEGSEAETISDVLDVVKKEMDNTPEPIPTTQKVDEPSQEKAVHYSDEQTKPKIEGSTTSITTGPIEVITRKPSTEGTETEKTTKSEELTTLEAES